jgi:hypothetical protein
VARRRLGPVKFTPVGRQPLSRRHAILSCSSPKSAKSWETRAIETPIRVATYSWVNPRRLRCRHGLGMLAFGESYSRSLPVDDRGGQQQRPHMRCLERAQPGEGFPGVTAAKVRAVHLSSQRAWGETGDPVEVVRESTCTR